VYKIYSFAKPKKAVPVEAAPAVEAAPTTTTGVPSIESPEFEKFVGTEAFEKLLENEKELVKLIESA
jgi:hypothetical protein